MQLSILHDFDDMTEMAMAVHEPESRWSARRNTARRWIGCLGSRSCYGRGEVRPAPVGDRRRAPWSTCPTRPWSPRSRNALIEDAPGLTRTQLARRAPSRCSRSTPPATTSGARRPQRTAGFECHPLPDGMAELRIRLTAIDARAAYDVLTQDARACPKDERTTDQKRADAFLDRFLGYGVTRKVQVHVTISLETPDGPDRGPGTARRIRSARGRLRP